MWHQSSSNLSYVIADWFPCVSKYHIVNHGKVESCRRTGTSLVQNALTLTTMRIAKPNRTTKSLSEQLTRGDHLQWSDCNDLQDRYRNKNAVTIFNEFSGGLASSHEPQDCYSTKHFKFVPKKFSRLVLKVQKIGSDWRTNKFFQGFSGWVDWLVLSAMHELSSWDETCIIIRQRQSLENCHVAKESCLTVVVRAWILHVATINKFSTHLTTAYFFNMQSSTEQCTAKCLKQSVVCFSLQIMALVQSLHTHPPPQTNRPVSPLQSCHNVWNDKVKSGTTSTSLVPQDADMKVFILAIKQLTKLFYGRKCILVLRDTEREQVITPSSSSGLARNATFWKR